MCSDLIVSRISRDDVSSLIIEFFLKRFSLIFSHCRIRWIDFLTSLWHFRYLSCGKKNGFESCHRKNVVSFMMLKRWFGLSVKLTSPEQLDGCGKHVSSLDISLLTIILITASFFFEHVQLWFFLRKMCIQVLWSASSDWFWYSWGHSQHINDITPLVERR